jgi:hypothetical protein
VICLAAVSVHTSSRASSRPTCVAYQWPPPRGVGTRRFPALPIRRAGPSLTVHVAPGKPMASTLTIADCRRILHAAQVMQLTTPQPAHELYALGRVGVWMRGMIREQV